jgi:hypothetical protein
MLKKSYSPLLYLTGALGFVLLTNFLSTQIKAIAFFALLVLILLIPILDARQIIKNTYRFKYLLLSVIVCNLVFMSHNPMLAADKFLLLLLVIFGVNIYLQIQTHEKIVAGLCMLFKPLILLGLDSGKMSTLVGDTLKSVQEFQKLQLNGGINLTSINSDFSIQPSLSERLCMWIEFVEKETT